MALGERAANQPGDKRHCTKGACQCGQMAWRMRGRGNPYRYGYRYATALVVASIWSAPTAWRSALASSGSWR
jgi:hypothetical protein